MLKCISICIIYVYIYIYIYIIDVDTREADTGPARETMSDTQSGKPKASLGSPPKLQQGLHVSVQGLGFRVEG